MCFLRNSEPMVMRNRNNLSKMRHRIYEMEY